MDYQLDHQIRLCQETKHKSLYSWSLQEVSENGEQIGLNQVPWNWSVYFSASELRYNKELIIRRESPPEDIFRRSEEISSAESITAVLHSGRLSVGGSFEREATYSMFGTNREIKDFGLIIRPLEEGDSKDSCTVWGCVSYTTEIDFRTETENDTFQIYLELSAERFNELRDLVNHVHPNAFLIRLGRVDGFYSEWSPSVSTNRIKVLTSGSEHKVYAPDGCVIDPPRLGTVGEFSLVATSKNCLELRRDSQDLGEENGLENQNDEDLYQSQERGYALNVRLGQLHQALDKLRWPMWLAVTLLFLLLLK